MSHFSRSVARIAGIMSIAVSILIIGPATSSEAASVRASASETPFVKPTEPPGYTLVTSGFENNGLGTAAVDCPAGTVVWGGGVVNSSSNLGVNVWESLPENPSVSDPGIWYWLGGANDQPDVLDPLAADAACADQPEKYSIQYSPIVSIPPLTHGTATATCPKGTVALGGGGMGGYQPVTLGDSFPTKAGKLSAWTVSVNNSLTEASGMAEAAVVCGKKPKGYAVVLGVTVDNPPGTESNATASCPTGSSVVGGGNTSSSTNIDVNVNTTIPDNADEWTVYENNASTDDDAPLTAFAICAR